MTTGEATMAPARRSAPREFVDAVATIMVKELRSRMRGRRAFVVLTVYLGLLALIAYGAYLLAAPAAAGGQSNASAQVGQAIFILLSIFQLVLICFIAPAATSGQISLEREKQTLDLLISTPMRPGAIVIGKMAAALAYVVLMIVAAIPITAIVLMYGGVTIGDIARQQLVLLATAVGLGAVGLFFSALIKRTQAATVLTYVTLLAITLGSAAVFVFWTIFANQDSSGLDVGPPEKAPEQILYVNPAIAMLDVIAGTGDPVGGFGLYQVLDDLRSGSAFAEPGVAEDCFAPDCPPFPQEQGVANYWWPRIALTFLAGAALLTVASMRLVVPPGMRGRPWRSRARPSASGAPDPGADEIVEPGA